MKLNDILNTVILFGCLQGFITSILLFFLKKNKLTNRLLAALIFVIVLASINLYGSYVNWFDIKFLQFFTQLLPMVVIMPLGPLLYFYMRSFIEPNFKIEKRFKYHFYPVLVDLIPSFTIIIYIIGLYSGLLNRNPKPWVNFIEQFNVYADIPRWASMTIYVGLASKYLSTAKLGLTSISETNLNWLKQFINVFTCFQGIWLLYLIPYVIPSYTNKILNAFGWYPIYLPLAILVYWLGIKGYMISHTQYLEIKRVRDIKNLLSDDDLITIAKSLQTAMEIEKLYLNPNMNLNTLAKHVHSSPRIASAVLNQHFHKSFNEFVNGYRVEEFKKKFSSSEFDHLTITGIALECGFNSQATFQRVFKESTGLSPSKFRKMIV
ncbi:helix-turn-helix domain-containing protein [Pedobacter sp. UC225_65]|uniref:helix-turn-helix domain-containing protein n=1 Tax=Pedobacter sp. UC225_65 TaxID=3350173 RepID=UPI00366CC70A